MAVAAALKLTAVLALPMVTGLSGNRSSSGIAVAAVALAFAAGVLAAAAIVIPGWVGVLPGVPP